MLKENKKGRKLLCPEESLGGRELAIACGQLSKSYRVGQSLSDKAADEERIGILPDLPARVRQ